MVTVRRPPPQPHVCCIILQPLITLQRSSLGVAEDGDGEAPDFGGAHPDFGKLPCFFSSEHTHTHALSPLPPPLHLFAQQRAHPKVTVAVCDP